MPTRFLHTSDWQIGKPFQFVEDPAKREALRRQRLDTLGDLRSLIEAHNAEFIVACGDLFDSSTPDASTVSALCSAVGSLEVPVYAIPGNHDHGGPGCVWEQDFFRREQAALAPNLHILPKPEPFVTPNAILLPCPLLRRHENQDPTAWLRSEPEALAPDLPRIVLAHGSTQGFSSSGESDEDAAVNRIDLSQLPSDAYDYIALGDWHGMKEIGPRSWFSGTPEQDRFAKGESNRPGHVCLVETGSRNRPPNVTPLATGKIGWHEPEVFALTGDADLDSLENTVESLIGQRTGRDLLKLRLHGTLSFKGAERLEHLTAQLEARLISLRLEKQIEIEPTTGELEALTGSTDPLIAQVAAALQAESATEPLARDALRELHLEERKVRA